MRITCKPGPEAGNAKYCSNWDELKFEINGKEYPHWKVMLVDDIQKTSQVFLTNEAGMYLYEGPGSPPAFETIRGPVKISGQTIKTISPCDQAVMAKKSWWLDL